MNTPHFIKGAGSLCCSCGFWRYQSGWNMLCATRTVAGWQGGKRER